jgi:hypothetical protein
MNRLSYLSAGIQALQGDIHKFESNNQEKLNNETYIQN